MPGVKDVKVVYRRGPKEIPARKEELHQAILENIEIIYNTQPVEVIDKNGAIAWSVLNGPGEARDVAAYKAALAKL